MSDLVDGAKAIKATVWPHREDFETGRFYSWRVVLALLTLYATGGLTVHLLWAAGLITIMGTSGSDYAKAADLKPLRDQQIQLAQRVDQRSNDIMGVIYGGQITDLQFKLCAASKSGSTDLARAYGDQLQDSMDKYFQATRRAYNLRACP